MGHSAGNGIDPTFYRSPADAISAPPEDLAYVAAYDRTAQQPDALAVLDTDPASNGYGQITGWADMPTRGDELHHFGWNVCSSAFAHTGHHTDGLQRRDPLLPGLRSSNIHVYDTHPDPRKPKLVRTISAAELADKAGYPARRPSTAARRHLSRWPGLGIRRGPGHRPARPRYVRRAAGWETARGRRTRATTRWHEPEHLITSQSGTSSMIEDGLISELLRGQ